MVTLPPQLNGDHTNREAWQGGIPGTRCSDHLKRGCVGKKPFNYLDTPHGKLMLAYQARRDMTLIDKERNKDIDAMVQKTLHKQVGGDYYSKMVIQPVEYILKNNLSYLEGNVIKYVSRHRAKWNGAGKKDLQKAIQYLEMIIETEYPTLEPGEINTKIEWPEE